MYRRVTKVVLEILKYIGLRQLNKQRLNRDLLVQEGLLADIVPNFHFIVALATHKFPCLIFGILEWL